MSTSSYTHHKFVLLPFDIEYGNLSFLAVQCMYCDRHYDTFILSAVGHWCIHKRKEHSSIICVLQSSKAFHVPYSYMSHNLWWFLIHLYPFIYLFTPVCFADCCWGGCSTSQNRWNCAFGWWRQQYNRRTDEVSGSGASSCPCPHRGWLIKGK
jgi:hypothetical protein